MSFRVSKGKINASEQKGFSARVKTSHVLDQNQRFLYYKYNVDRQEKRCRFVKRMSP